MGIPKHSRTLNVFADISLIVIGVLLAGLIAYQIWGMRAVHESEYLKSGERFKGLEEYNLTKKGHAILIGFDIDCPPCRKSLPFYKKLIRKSKDKYKDYEVIVLFGNQKERVKRFLKEYNFDVRYIADLELFGFGIDATPTVILMHQDRTIIKAYTGFLTKNQQQDFITLIK